jgi:hypothetical protein
MPLPLMCDAWSRVHSFAQLRRGKTERLGELGDVFDSRIPQAAFDVADVGGIEAGFLGELFLREGFGVPLAADISPQRGKNRFKFRHGS